MLYIQSQTMSGLEKAFLKDADHLVDLKRKMDTAHVDKVIDAIIIDANDSSKSIKTQLKEIDSMNKTMPSIKSSINDLSYLKIQTELDAIEGSMTAMTSQIQDMNDGKPTATVPVYHSSLFKPPVGPPPIPVSAQPVVPVAAPVKKVFPDMIMAPTLPEDPPLPASWIVPSDLFQETALVYYKRARSGINNAYSEYASAYKKNAVQFNNNISNLLNIAGTSTKDILIDSTVTAQAKYQSEYVRFAKEYNAVAVPMGFAPLSTTNANASYPVAVPRVIPVPVAAAPVKAPVGVPIKKNTPVAAPTRQLVTPTAPPSTYPLVCYYPFNFTLDDATGNTSMDIAGSEWYLDGESDKGLYLGNVLQYSKTNSTDPVNRSVNYLTLSTPYDISKPTTVSGWVQIVKVPYPGQSATILDFGTGDSTDYLQLVAYNDNPSTSYRTDCMLFATAGNAGTYSNGTRINQDTWVHFAVVFVPSKSLTLYVNGMMISNITTGVGAGGSGATFKIGDAATNSYTGKGYRPFAGIVDEFRIHAIALSQADVTKLYTMDLKGSPAAAPVVKAVSAK